MRYAGKYNLKNVMFEGTNTTLNKATTNSQYEAEFVKLANAAIQSINQTSTKPVKEFRSAEYNKKNSYVRIFALPNSFENDEDELLFVQEFYKGLNAGAPSTDVQVAQPGAAGSESGSYNTYAIPNWVSGDADPKRPKRSGASGEVSEIPLKLVIGGTLTGGKKSKAAKGMQHEARLIGNFTTAFQNLDLSGTAAGGPNQSVTDVFVSVGGTTIGIEAKMQDARAGQTTVHYDYSTRKFVVNDYDSKPDVASEQKRLVDAINDSVAGSQTHQDMMDDIRSAMNDGYIPARAGGTQTTPLKKSDGTEHGRPKKQFIYRKLTIDNAAQSFAQMISTTGDKSLPPDAPGSAFVLTDDYSKLQAAKKEVLDIFKSEIENGSTTFEHGLLGRDSWDYDKAAETFTKGKRVHDLNTMVKYFLAARKNHLGETQTTYRVKIDSKLGKQLYPEGTKRLSVVETFGSGTGYPRGSEYDDLVSPVIKHYKSQLASLPGFGGAKGEGLQIVGAFQQTAQELRQYYIGKQAKYIHIEGKGLYHLLASEPFVVDGVSTVFFDYNTPGKGVVGFSSSNNRYSLRSNITGNPFKGLPTSPIKLDGDDAAVANCEEFINQINKEIVTA